MKKRKWSQIKLLKNKLNSSFLNKLKDAFIGRISYLLFTLIFSLVATRLYGAEVFGIFTYAFTLMSIVMILAKAGLDNGLLYSIPKNKNRHVSFSFLTNLLFSLILIVMFIFILDSNYVKYMLPLIWLLSVEQIFFALYRAEGNIKGFYKINGFYAMAIRIVIIVVFYYLFGENATGLAIGVYLSLIFANLVYFFHHKDKFRKIVLDYEHLKYSFPLVFATMLSTLINKIDIVMLGMFASNQEVGIYQITVQISNMVALSLSIFNTVFAPLISNLFHNNNLIELKKLYVKATRWLGVIALFTIVIILFSSDFILGIFGEEIKRGQDALFYRSIGQFFNIAVGSVWLMLSMTGKPSFQMYANIITCIINIILNLILIPKMGMDGAAIATMCSITLINIIGYIVVSRRFNLKVFKVF